MIKVLNINVNGTVLFVHGTGALNGTWEWAVTVDEPYFRKSDVTKIAALIKPRLNSLLDIKTTSSFFFNRPEGFENKDLKKFKNLDFNNIIRSIVDLMDKDHDLNLFKENLEEIVKFLRVSQGKWTPKHNGFLQKLFNLLTFYWKYKNHFEKFN